jgi:hypothetical protein
MQRQVRLPLKLQEGASYLVRTADLALFECSIGRKETLVGIPKLVPAPGLHNVLLPTV